MFGYQEQTSICYCKTEGLRNIFKLDYYVWIECLSTEICVTWIFVLMLSNLAAFVHFDEKVSSILIVSKRFVKLLCLTKGEIPIPKRNTLYVCIAISGMLCGWFYENRITSLVTAAIPAQPMKNLNEVIANGFKITFQILKIASTVAL